MLAPATVALMRGICEIADRAQEEVRFNDREWWRERCRYRLSDIGVSLGFASRLSWAGGEAFDSGYDALWFGTVALGGIGRRELIAGLEPLVPGCGSPAFAALLHARAARKLWLSWHPSLADAHASFARLRRLALAPELGREEAIYLFAALVKERKQILFSVLEIPNTW